MDIHTLKNKNKTKGYSIASDLFLKVKITIMKYNDFCLVICVVVFLFLIQSLLHPQSHSLHVYFSFPIHSLRAIDHLYTYTRYIQVVLPFSSIYLMTEKIRYYINTRYICYVNKLDEITSDRQIIINIEFFF